MNGTVSHQTSRQKYVDQSRNVLGYEGEYDVEIDNRIWILLCGDRILPEPRGLSHRDSNPRGTLRRLANVYVLDGRVCDRKRLALVLLQSTTAMSDEAVRRSQGTYAEQDVDQEAFIIRI